jgi:hypothetical protein
MRTKVNLRGGGFSHGLCSSGLLAESDINKYIQWVKDESANISVHIDEGLYFPIDKNKKNFGWILESSAIVPHIISDVLNNINFFKDKFEFIFTCDRSIIARDPTFFKFTIPNAVPWVQNRKIYNKKKLISFIGSNKAMCDGHTYRHKIIKKLEGKVDHYGRGFGAKELPNTFLFEGNLESGKLLGVQDYMFSIAMENKSYDTYFTEKITDCFAAGTIPVFFGNSDIKNYFNADGIIMFDENFNFSSLNEDIYYSKIEAVKENLEIAKNLLTAEDFIFLNYLK